MHFVYVDTRADDGTPFYVGIGNKHRVKRERRNQIWDRIVAKHGFNREIVMVTSVHNIAIDEEIRLIKELKTRNRLGGANITDGGEGNLGWNPSEKTRKRMRAKKVGRKLSKSHRKAMSDAHKKRYRSSIEREKTGIQMRKVWSDPIYRQTLKQKHKGANNSRAKLTQSDVNLIRSKWASYDASKRGATKAFCRRFATKHDVTTMTIYYIIKEKSWS